MKLAAAFNQGGKFPTIGVVNQATTPLGCDFKALVKALQKFLNQHFVPIWGYPAKLKIYGKVEDIPKDQWVFLFLDDADSASALGYHELTLNNQPVSKVFVKTTLEAGESVSTTAAHELCEQLIDPSAQLWAQRADGVFVAYEMCLVGDTKIRLSDGTTETIRNLATRVNSDCDVISWQNGKIVSSKACNARLTQKQASVLRIRFSDGTFVRCTPNHRFLSTYDYLRADQLRRGDVLPCATSSNPANLRATDSKPFADGTSRFRTRDNFSNKPLSQFRAPAPFASHPAISCHSTFFAGIQHVLKMAPDKEMVGIDATRHVTGMANFFPLWDRPSMHVEGSPMRHMDDSIIPDLSVPLVGFRARPQPATVGITFNARPKAILKRRSSRVVSLVASRSVGSSRDTLTFPMHRTKALGSDRSLALSHRALSSNFSLLLPVRATNTFRANEIPATNNSAYQLHCLSIDAVEEDGKDDVYDLTVPATHNFMLENGIFAHNCDPCEEQSFKVDGIDMSDFVYPSYFESWHKKDSVKFDYLGQLTKPFDIAKGGYLIINQDGVTSNIFGSKAKAKRFEKEDRRLHRSQYRK